MKKVPMIAVAMFFALGSAAFAQGAGGGAGGGGAGAGGGQGPATATGQGASSTGGSASGATTGMDRPNTMERPMANPSGGVTSPSGGESSQGNVGPGTARVR